MGPESLDRVNAAGRVGPGRACAYPAARKLAAAEKTIAETRTAAMGNVRGIAADAAGAIVQRLTGATPDAGAVNTAVDAALKG